MNKVGKQRMDGIFLSDSLEVHNKNFYKIRRKGNYYKHVLAVIFVLIFISEYYYFNDLMDFEWSTDSFKIDSKILSHDSNGKNLFEQFSDYFGN